MLLFVATQLHSNTVTITATIMILDTEELCHPGYPSLLSMRKTGGRRQQEVLDSSLAHLDSGPPLLSPGLDSDLS